MNALAEAIEERIALRAGSTLRVEDGAGLVLQVWEGEVWLTQEGDSRDLYLRANDWFRIERDGATVIAAVGENASVSFTPLHEHRYAKRIVLSGAA